MFFGVSHPRLAHRSPFVPKPPKTLLRWKISGGKFVAPPPSIFSITPHKTHTPASSIIQLRRRLALVIVGKSKSTVWSSYTRKNHVGTLYLASGLPRGVPPPKTGNRSYSPGRKKHHPVVRHGLLRRLYFNLIIGVIGDFPRRTGTLLGKVTDGDSCVHGLLEPCVSAWIHTAAACVCRIKLHSNFYSKPLTTNKHMVWHVLGWHTWDWRKNRGDDSVQSRVVALLSMAMIRPD